jgi:hypothetical protein
LLIPEWFNDHRGGDAEITGVLTHQNANEIDLDEKWASDGKPQTKTTNRRP